jgi:hypothetical protein
MQIRVLDGVLDNLSFVDRGNPSFQAQVELVPGLNALMIEAS